MNLLIDIGNTSAKLAIMDGDEFLHIEHKADPWQPLFKRLSDQYPISCCAISSVAGEDTELIRALQEWDIPTLLLGINAPADGKTTSKIVNYQLSNCQIKNVPTGYGADRLAADLGAISQSAGRTLLVIDAGTCITYDLISRNGEILGGAISPGIQLRLRAMHEHTALLPLFQAEADTPLIGHDTKTSMMSSAIHGTSFEVEGYIRHLLTLYPDLQVYLTGGNTLQLSADFTSHVTHDPHLLFRGLQSMLRNEGDRDKT